MFIYDKSLRVMSTCGAFLSPLAVDPAVERKTTKQNKTKHFLQGATFTHMHTEGYNIICFYTEFGHFYSNYLFPGDT